MATVYEWTVEETDDYGDIVDEYFYDDLSDIGDVKQLLKEGFSIGLLKRKGDDIQGETHRTYAYIDSDTYKLEEYFDDGTKVPKRFIESIEKF